jgi:hypothetical protein
MADKYSNSYILILPVNYRLPLFLFTGITKEYCRRNVFIIVHVVSQVLPDIQNTSQ